MAQITQSQYKILDKIDKGKYIYPHSCENTDNPSQDYKNVNYLHNINLIYFHLGEDSQPHYVDFVIQHEGIIALEIFRLKRRQEVHMWSTLAIALAALITSIVSIFA